MKTKPSAVKQSLFALALGAMAIASADAQTVILNETFTYPNGNLVGNGGWTAHSGAGLFPIQVSAGGVLLQQGTNVSREDANRPFDGGRTITAGETFTATFSLSVVGTAPVTDVYFAHFGTGVSTFNTRLFVTSGTSGDFTLGISNTASAPDTKLAQGLNLGTSYTPSISFTLSPDGTTGTASLTLGSETINATTNSTAAIAGFYVRQSTGNTTQRIDNVVVTAIPEPASVAFLAFGGLVLGARRRRGA